MTTDEAIKRLTNKANECWNKDELRDADACQLGIEALKRVRWLRAWGLKAAGGQLRGETAE